MARPKTKTDPIGVRFNIEKLKTIQEKENLDSPQKVLDFLMDGYGIKTIKVSDIRKEFGPNKEAEALVPVPDVIEVKYYYRFYLFVVPEDLKIPKKDPNPPA